MRARTAIVALLLALGAANARAQGANGDGEIRGRWSVGPYVGGARHSLVGTHLGVTPDRDHLFIGIHATVPFVSSRHWALAYAPEVVPLLVISNNPKYRQVVSDGFGDTFPEYEGTGPVAGFAVSPIGVEVQRTLASRIRGYGAGAGGVVWFTRNVPTYYSRAFNFTFEFGGGVLWRFNRRDSLRVGYKFHHLSNAYTAPDNPGIDGAVFLLGFERAIGSRR